MSQFVRKNKIGFNFSKSHIKTSNELKNSDFIPFVTGLYNDNYPKQNINNDNNLGLYTYWGDYENNPDKLFYNDIQIEEFNLNLNSDDRDLNVNKNPLNFTIWLNPGNTHNKSFLPRIYENVKYINFEHIIFPKLVDLNKFNALLDLSANIIMNDINNNFTYNANHDENIAKIDSDILNYQICNVQSSTNYLQINFTIDFKKKIVYEYTNTNNIIKFDKYSGLSINSPGNHIQFICIQPTNNKFIFNTKNKSVFRQIYPALKKQSDLFLAVKKSFIVYKNTDLLNIYKIDIKLLDANYEPIIIHNLDVSINPDIKCLCELDVKKYSCKCYYLRHPLNKRFQLDIFLKLGCLKQEFNKKNYMY